MPTFKITVAYDGTGLVGWQRQESGVSVQSLLEEALGRIDDHDVAVTGAGRTDAGVHALGQVASFTLARSIEPAALARALNAILPATVRVTKAEPADPTFHARFDATRKSYRYRISNQDVQSPFDRDYAWHVVGPLDADAMGAAAILLEGRHDFAAFQAAGSSTASTVRDVFSSRIATGASDDCSIDGGLGPDAGGRDTVSRGPVSSYLGTCPDQLIVYDVTGSGFLRHMVRTIVGSLVEIGRGRRPVEWMQEILDARTRRLAGPTAPPCGLVLVAVEYEVQSRPRTP